MCMMQNNRMMDVEGPPAREEKDLRDDWMRKSHLLSTYVMQKKRNGDDPSSLFPRPDWSVPKPESEGS